MKKAGLSLTSQLLSHVLFFTLVLYLLQHHLYEWENPMSIALFAVLLLVQIAGMILEFRYKKETRVHFPWYIQLIHGILSLSMLATLGYLMLLTSFSLNTFTIFTAFFAIADLVCLTYCFSTNVPSKKEI